MRNYTWFRGEIYPFSLYCRYENNKKSGIARAIGSKVR